ncbi:MAG TPA: acyltransferase family protein [Streptosporangiaceae bacterium]|nr:acyltransferase family protein [Streptosporangiaceae bacterium]
MPLSADAPAGSLVPAQRSAPAPETDRPAAATAAAGRDPYYDNVKFLAVVLVVLGHAWYSLADSRLTAAAHLFVYTFHMPVFIVVAGFFSRRFATTPSKVRRLAAGLGVPYLIFEAAYPLYAHIAHGDRFIWSPLSPYWIMWFLPALFVWRLSAPLWQQLRGPLVVAVAVSLASGAMRLPDQAATRILGFLPFFVIGLLLREEHVERLRTRPARVAATLVTIAAAVTAVLVAPRLNEEWFSYRAGYADLGVSAYAGIAMRMGTLICGLAMTAAFLSLTPRRRTWFTGLGGRSMYVYLLHGFFTFGATYAGWYAAADRLGPIGGFAAVSVLGVLLAVALAARPVRRACRWAVEPRLDWAFRTGRPRPRPRQPAT